MNIHIICFFLFSFVDEEIGGMEGMNEFVKLNKFKNLNVGFALDEGMASPNDEFALFYAERCIWSKYFILIVVNCNFIMT